MRLDLSQFPGQVRGMLLSMQSVEPLCHTTHFYLEPLAHIGRASLRPKPQLHHTRQLQKKGRGAAEPRWLCCQLNLEIHTGWLLQLAV